MQITIISIFILLVLAQSQQPNNQSIEIQSTITYVPQIADYHVTLSFINYNGTQLASSALKPKDFYVKHLLQHKHTQGQYSQAPIIEKIYINIFQKIDSKVIKQTQIDKISWGYLALFMLMMYVLQEPKESIQRSIRIDQQQEKLKNWLVIEE